MVYRGYYTTERCNRVFYAAVISDRYLVRCYLMSSRAFRVYAPTRDTSLLETLEIPIRYLVRQQVDRRENHVA
jgi:hypothetical protein